MKKPVPVTDSQAVAESPPANRLSEVTSKDVARAAGVSRPAVSRILNGHGDRFSAQTRERVLRAARELNYQPSAAGRSLRRGASELVVALIPHTTWGSHLQDLVDSCTDELATLGLTLVLRFPHSSSESFDRLVRTMRPLAVVTMTPVPEADRNLLSDRGIQLIEPPVGQVERFDKAIGCCQAEHLIARGYTRLAYARLRDAREDVFGHAREAGFREECRERGLPEPAALALSIDVAEAGRQLAGLSHPGRAIACYNDDVALALLSAAQRSGRRVPDDIALVGMDNTPFGALFNPPLTTVEADMLAARRSLVHFIVSAVRGDPVAEGPSQSPVRLRLIQRATT
jgi:DNA-binding LacI/PurR family transcriptional regulator